MRAAFEGWITTTTALSIARIEQRGYAWHGDYAVASVDNMWRAWQAACDWCAEAQLGEEA